MSIEKSISENKLVEYKIPFVLRDLEMGFNAGTLERESVEKLRYWQIVITIGLVTLIIGNKNIIGNTVISSYFSVIIFFINIIISYIEVRI